MIISHEYRFIFIKTLKTAGTSIEAYLSGHCGPEDVVTPISPPEPGHVARNYGEFYNHFPAYKVRAAVGEDTWNGYMTFCVERNPWDKFISYYFMLRNSPHHGQHATLTMDEYLERGPFPLNYPTYMDEAESKIIVKRVLRYENLAAELNSVFQSLGIPFNGDLGYRAKGDRRTDRRPYWEFLTPRQIERIAEIAAKDIQLQGYRRGSL